MDLRIGTILLARNALKQMPVLAENGFECFEITFGESTREYPLAEMAARTRDAMGDSGAVISSMGVYANVLDGTGIHADALRSMEDCIDHAHLFGCDTVSCFAGRVPGASVEASLPRFRKVFGPLVERAKDHGVRLVMENCSMGDSWQSGGWNIALNPTAWEMIFNEIPDPALGLEWEPAHQLTSLIEPIPQLRKWAKRVYHVHGKDATIAWDVIRECGINSPAAYRWDRTPGFGDSNWSDIITILRMNGYHGTIDIEGYHDPVYSNAQWEWTSQLRALEYLKQCRGGSRELIL